MKSSFKLLASLLFMTVATNSSALGLGEVKTESALNEPLVARIELLNADSLTNNDLIVAIGSQEDYRIAQVEREFIHTDFTLEARLDGEATPYISLTSSRAIVEPFVNFVVQVRWPQGKLLREYTILIDFPVFTGAQESQSVAVATTQPAARTQTRPTATASPQDNSSNLDLRTTPNTQTRRTLTAGTGEYYVQTGDTLWGVSGSVARSTGTTRNQAMLSIRDLNPEAFINGDVNALKSGVLLRVPNQQQIVQRSAADAAREFAAIQNSGGRNNIEETPVQATDSSFRNQPASTTPTRGRLALASATALGSSTGSNATGAEGSELMGSLEGENIVLKEELDKVEIENADLRDRLAALEERLEVTEALIEIENNELALAQQVAAEINAANADELSEPLIDEVVSAEEELELEAEAEPVVEEVAVAPQAQTVQEKSILDTAIGFFPYIGVVFVVLLLVVFLLLKRRKSKSDDLLSDDNEPDYEVDHIDQNLSMDGSIEDEMQATRSFTVDQDDDDVEGIDTLFSEDTDDEDELFEEMEADTEVESQHMEDTLANFEATNVMAAQSSDELDVDELGVDELGVDELGVDELGVDELGVDELGVDDSDGLESDDFGYAEDDEDASADSELDEFADLDSFFNDDDIEDFDPAAPDDAGELEQVSSTGEASSSDGTKDDAFSDSTEKMEFESFDIPSDSSSESIAKASLDHSNSMDFEVGIDLPEIDEIGEDSALEVDLNDSDRSMDFDLDDIDPISDEDEITPLESIEDNANSMDFDLSGVDLGGLDDSDDEDALGLDESDSDGGLDFSFDSELSDQTSDDNLDIETLDFDAVDEELESDMDDLLSDMADQSEIASALSVEQDESVDVSDFDLGDDDLLGGLDIDSDVGSDLSEEIATKLELADAYADMGDARGAKELVEEILADGDESQKDAARLIAERLEGLI